jgi:serralysin
VAENSSTAPSSGGNNAYQGPAANDSFGGGGGNDRLLGGDGDDRISGDAPLAGQWTYSVYSHDFSTATNQTGQIASGTLLGTGYVDDFNVLALRNTVTGTAQGTNQDDFGVIYQSNLTITTGGTYTFGTTSDDGSRIIIRDAGGNIVFNLDNDRDQSAHTATGTVTLQAGQTYAIELYYWENLGDSVFSATIAGPGGSTTDLATSPLLGTPPLASGHVDGNDSLYGQAGNDTLTGGGANDRLYGGSEADSVLGEAGNDLVDGGSGSDQLYGGADNDTILGGTGDDSVFGGTGDDSIEGGDGNDTLYFGSGNDTVHGGAGDDIIDDVANDQLTGTNLLYGEDGNDNIWSGFGNDVVYGGAGNDSIFAESGNDTLYGGSGADLIYGGADRDTIIIGAGDFAPGDFVDGGSNGDDFDVLDLSGYGWARTDIVYTSTDHQSGTVTFYDTNGQVTGTMNFVEIERVVPCFTAGTLIETPTGPRAVESLLPGDLVMTLDEGPQPVRWVGKRSLGVAELVANPALQPIVIAAGAVGPGMPARDITVSPQHRVLLGGACCELFFGTEDVLVPAVHLLEQPGIRQRLQPVTYVHLLFDRHQIVEAHGLWSESYQPGECTLYGLPRLQRDELLALFPELEVPGSYPAARMTLKAHESRVLLSA